MNSLLEALIAAKLSGGSVTPASIAAATGQMTEEQKAATRTNIGAVSLDEIGTVFTLKGGVATVADLPASGNSVGDVYYVEAVSAGYIWITSTSQPNGYWEELGETFDVTVDSELSPTSENPVQNKVINAALAAKGTYSKPSGGIPKTDLSSAVQTSLGKADTALQSVPTTYRTAASQDLVDEAQDARINQKANAADLSEVATSGSYNDLSNKPTIPTVPTDEISANTAARHTHSNKALLDTYTQTEVNLAAAVSKKHSHSNKAVLDGITAAKLLPAVTSSDNDKFLRVVSGAWAAVTVPSAESNSF